MQPYTQGREVVMQEKCRAFIGNIMRTMLTHLIKQLIKQIERAELAKFYQTIAILFEVLKTFTQTEDVEVAPEILAAGRDIKENTEMLLQYHTQAR